MYRRYFWRNVADLIDRFAAGSRTSEWANRKYAETFNQPEAVQRILRWRKALRDQPVPKAQSVQMTRYLTREDGPGDE